MTTPEVTIPAFTVPPFLVTLLVAALCGAIAQLLVGYTRGGCLASMLVGLVGALVGWWLAGTLRMPTILPVFGIDIIWTILGSAIFVALLSLAMGGSRWRGFRRRSY
jgi:uncharacterized membrane protein YeaQ/YmgE (transglycosylase-associated protein family)